MITIGFTRTDNGIFLPHVDVLRNLNRTFRRAEMDVDYSKGFVKHMLLKLTQPLPFGVADTDCYVTADLDGFAPSEAIDRFNDNCPPFLRAHSAFITEKNPGLAGLINASKYFVKGNLTPDQIDAINNLPSDYTVTTVRKEGEVTKSTAGLIMGIKASADGVFATLAFGNVNLRIDVLIEQFNKDFGTIFEVTDVTRTQQLIISPEKSLSAEEYLSAISQIKIINGAK